MPPHATKSTKKSSHKKAQKHKNEESHFVLFVPFCGLVYFFFLVLFLDRIRVEILSIVAAGDEDEG